VIPHCAAIHRSALRPSLSLDWSAVFGRRGPRPFTLEEAQKLYLRNGQLWTVSNDPPGPRSQ
jgi:hypothetical protein